MTAIDLTCRMKSFSIGMAEIVGEKGLVMAADIQRKMLDVAARRASSRGAGDRIQSYPVMISDPCNWRVRLDYRT